MLSRANFSKSFFKNSLRLRTIIPSHASNVIKRPHYSMPPIPSFVKKNKYEILAICLIWAEMLRYNFETIALNSVKENEIKKGSEKPRTLTPFKFTIPPDPHVYEAFFLPFVQKEFISYVNQRFSSIHLSNEGVCHGLLMMWYISQFRPNNFISELLEIREALSNNQELTSSQIHLLKDIHIIQEKQAWKLSFGKLRTYSIKEQNCPEDSNQWIRNVVSDAIENPGRLMILLFHKKISPTNIFDWIFNPSQITGHNIGVIAKRTNDKLVIKCFDSNMGEFTYDDDRLAVEVLHSLYLNLYANIYSNATSIKSIKCVSLQKKVGLFSWSEDSLSESGIVQNESATLDLDRNSLLSDLTNAKT